jgi:hypothetical protein
LAGFVALLGLVDDIDSALAAHHLVVAMTPAQRFQRITDFHRSRSQQKATGRDGRFRRIDVSMPYLPLRINLDRRLARSAAPRLCGVSVPARRVSRILHAPAPLANAITNFKTFILIVSREAEAKVLASVWPDFCAQ